MYRFKQPYYNILALFVYIDSHIALVLLNSINTLGGPRNFSSVKVSKAEFEGGGWLVV